MSIMHMHLLYMYRTIPAIMGSETKSERVWLVNLRVSLSEGYSFPCGKRDCPGKAGGDALPAGCRLLEYAKLISSKDPDYIESQLVGARCSG